MFVLPLQKTLRDKHYKAQQSKVERLEKLCRALQKERTELNQKLTSMQGKEPVEEGTGPPDPQPETPHGSCSPEPEAEAEQVEPVPGTEEPGLQPDGEPSSLPTRQLVD